MAENDQNDQKNSDDGAPADADASPEAKAKAEADKSETQKAIDRAAKSETEAEAARAELATERLKGSFEREANKPQFGADGKQKFIDIDAAYTLVMADKANAAIEPSGVADALKALAKVKPWLLEAVNAQRNTSPAQGKQSNQKTSSPVLSGAGRY